MGAGRYRLTAPKVANYCKPGYLLDGGGLYLQVTRRAPAKPKEKRNKQSDEVAKSWVFRYRDRVTHKLREMGLGSYSDVSLEKARELAQKKRDLLHDGKDPIAERKKKLIEIKAEEAKSITFDEAAAKCIAAKRGGWTNAKHADQWTNTLATYASPVIGHLPVSVVDLALVLDILEPIWMTINETASRVRQRIESVLSWSKVKGYREGENPARWRGHLDQILAPPSKVKTVEHHRAMPYREMGDFIVSLRRENGISPRALEFTILTAARTAMTIGATWSEINFEKKYWIIPADRMKGRKAHKVPLSPRALVILKGMQIGEKGSFIFPGVKPHSHLSSGSMDKLLQEDMARIDATVHGFRSTFRDWAGEETNFPRDVIEHALAHRLKDKAEAAYARGTLFKKRIELMNAWEEFCGAPSIGLKTHEEVT